MNERPFTAKQTAAPHAASAMPAKIGPITRARLNCIEFIAMAFETSSRFTSSGRSEMYAGPLNDCALPVRNDRTKMCQTLTLPEKSSAASTNAKLICRYCESSMILRRSTRSATAPPKIEKTSIGPVERNPSTPSRNGESVIFSTTHPCATVCIHVPVVDRNAPIHSRRKSRYRSALNVLASRLPGARGSASDSSASSSGSDVLIGCQRAASRKLRALVPSVWA
jgi:hypothetical protein